MKILIRNHISKNWKVIESLSYEGEKELKKLLLKSPSVIPMDDILEEGVNLLVAFEEFGLPGSGATDILCFSARGDIAIVECKLANNSEIKRKVIGQILEYGAYLWGKSYEEINQHIYEKHGKNLLDLITEQVEDPEWDEEEFRNKVIESLKSGSFILIIAVDEMNDELSRTIKYLNECANPHFSLSALEIRQFKTEDEDILVPHLFGKSAVGPPTTSPRGVWTWDKFYEVIQKDLKPEVVDVITGLHKWCKDKADKFAFGTGAETGTFVFYYRIKDTPRQIFNVSTKGKISLAHHTIKDKIDKDIYLKYHQAIRSIPIFKNIPPDMSSVYTVGIDQNVLRNKEDIETFKKAVEELGSSIHL